MTFGRSLLFRVTRVAIVATLTVLFGACGKDGPTSPSSTQTPAATTTPKSDPFYQPLPGPPASTSSLSPDARALLMSMCITPWGGAVTRWADGARIKIYADPEINQSDLKLATAFWEGATSGKVAYDIVSDKSTAQVTVNWKYPPDLPETSCSTAAPGLVLGFAIQAGTVYFTYGSNLECTISDSLKAGAIAHELGHTLGFAGHSPYEDIMKAVNPPFIMSPVFTEVVRWLYSTPVGSTVGG